MRIPVVGIVLCLVAASSAVAPGIGPAFSAQTSRAAAALANHRVWGRAFPAVLRQMNAWASIREVEVVLHRTRLVGSREFELAQGRRAAAVLEEGLRGDLGSSRLAIERWWGDLSLACRGFTVHLRPRKMHVVLEAAADDCDLLSPDVTADLLRNELGPPESIARRILPANDDRTEIWSLYSYAGGAVIFVESNYAARDAGGRRGVDRVLLNPLKLVRLLEMQRR